MATIQERISRDGNKSYRVMVRLRGFPAQTETFVRKTDAKRWAQKVEAAVREGKYFEAETRKHTFHELIDRYIKSVLPQKPKSQHKQRAQLEWWKQAIGDRLLTHVTSSIVSECRDQLLEGSTYRGTKRSPATVVRYLAVLSHVFTIAHKEWGWVNENPIRKISRPKESRGRVRFLNDSERNALLEACKISQNKALYPIVILALSTGMRQGEILNLRRDDVDFERGVIVLHYTKNNERRCIPLVGLAKAVLFDWEKNSPSVPM